MQQPYKFASSQTRGTTGWVVPLMLMATFVQSGYSYEPEPKPMLREGTHRSTLLSEELDSMNSEYYRPSEFRSDESRQLEIIKNFTTNLLVGMEDVDENIAKVINTNFWDIYERF